MPRLTRRAALLAPLALPFVGRAGAAALLPVRFSLEWKYQSVHAPFLLAQQRGYFAR